MTVTPVNETPEITGGSETPTFAEIEGDASTADLEVETYTARDEETETISWSLAGTDAGDFSINPNSGVLSFASRPNYEMPADADTDTTDSVDDAMDNDYAIIVKARDTASNTRDFPVIVTVTNVDETPEVTGPANMPNFPETPYDSMVTPNDVATFSARDEEMQVITWTLAGVDAGDFTITKNAVTGVGVVTFNSPPNYEMLLDSGSDGTYEFTVEATDTASPSTNTGTWDYAVTVTDINETPELTGTITTTVTYDENTTIDVAGYTARDEEGGVTWSLTGTDSGDFAIDSGGTVSFVVTPNFEDPDDSNNDNVYTFTVVATDVVSGPTRLTDSEDVTVTVADVEEPGVISVSNLNPAVGETVTFMLTDPDGGIVTGVSPDGFSWVIQTRTPGGAWQQQAVTNNISASYPYTADEDDTGLELRAVVNGYTDRRGPGKDVESERTAAITADPIVNAPPRFREGGTQSVPESDAGSTSAYRSRPPTAMVTA